MALKGLGDADYRVKELVGTPVRFDCLKSGECDAVPLGQPDDLIAIEQGYRRLGLSTEAVASFQFEVIAARRDLARQPTRTAVVRFVRALADAFRFIRDPAHRDEVVKAIVALTGSSDDIARATLALYFEPDRGVLPQHAEIDLDGLGPGHRVHGGGRHDQAAAAGAGAVRRSAIPSRGWSTVIHLSPRAGRGRESEANEGEGASPRF